jgi:hypothetical protein
MIGLLSDQLTDRSPYATPVVGGERYDQADDQGAAGADSDEADQAPSADSQVAGDPAGTEGDPCPAASGSRLIRASVIARSAAAFLLPCASHVCPTTL